MVNLETIFSRVIFFKGFMLILIIAWGAHVQVSNQHTDLPSVLNDIGGVVFFLFSLSYFINSYFLYTYNILGKLFFIPLVIVFLVLGFLTELFNPSQFSKDLFYLLIFYVISPIFFILQGVLVALLYFTDIKTKFQLQNS